MVIVPISCLILPLLEFNMLVSNNIEIDFINLNPQNAAIIYALGVVYKTLAVGGRSFTMG